MKKSLSEAKKRPSEEELDAWLLATDLSKLSSKIKFKRVSFPRLKPTDWDKFMNVRFKICKLVGYLRNCK